MSAAFWVLIVSIFISLIVAVIIFAIFDVDAIFFRLMMAVVGGVFVGSLACLFIVAVWGHAGDGTEHIAKTETLELKALNNNDNIANGQIFLGSGKIDSVPSIQYMSKAADGEVVLESVRTSKVKIYENSEAKPTVKKLTYDLEVDRGFFGKVTRKNYKEQIEFTIPSDSIQSNYNVIEQYNNIK